MSDEVIAALLGVGLGSGLTLLVDWWKDRRRCQAHWAALTAEIDYCRDRAEVYLDDKIAAPSFRLPTFTYANSLPSLLASGALDEIDTRNLLSFSNELEAFNRGLDQTAAARQISPERFDQEYKRNKIKAGNVLRQYNTRKRSYGNTVKQSGGKHLRPPFSFDTFLTSGRVKQAKLGSMG
jgi:hypothetical protein